MRVFRFLSIPFLVFFLGCSHTLNVRTEGQGSVRLNPPGGTYFYGTTVNLTAIPATGWSFLLWSGDLSGTNSRETVIMDSDISVTATFGQQFTLTVTTVDQGSVRLDPPSDTYDCGTALTVTAIPNSGWRFDGWSGDVSGVNNPIVLSWTLTSASRQLSCKNSREARSELP